MRSLDELIGNHIFLAVISAWLIASILKGFINIFQKKKFDIWRFLGHGGMPSTHSAAVTSLASSVILKDGWGATTSAVAVVLAFIVMVDAAGVRQATGRHAKALNQIIQEGFEGKLNLDILHEFIGHTPLQVIFGAIIGISVGILIA